MKTRHTVAHTLSSRAALHTTARPWQVLPQPVTTHDLMIGDVRNFEGRRRYTIKEVYHVAPFDSCGVLTSLNFSTKFSLNPTSRINFATFSSAIKTDK